MIIVMSVKLIKQYNVTQLRASIEWCKHDPFLQIIKQRSNAAVMCKYSQGNISRGLIKRQQS